MDQNNFSGGEVSTRVAFRRELDRYRSSLASCENFFPSQYGPADLRNGLRFRHYTQYGDVGGVDKNTQLIPFAPQTAPGDLVTGYVLEFGHHSIRFWKGGELQPEGATPHAVATPYDGTELAQLRYAQSGETLYLVHPNHAPRKLRKTGDGETDWALTTVAHDRPAPYFYGGTPMVRPSSHDSLLPNDKFARGKQDTEDASRPMKEWGWKVTAVCQDNAGRVWETAPQQVTTVLARGYSMWNPYKTYAVDDRVSMDYLSGTYYVCIGATTGNEPGTGGGAAFWDGPLPCPVWEPGVVYAANALVHDEGGFVFRSKQNDNRNHPLSDPAWWGTEGEPPFVEHPLPAQVQLYPATAPGGAGPITLEWFNDPYPGGDGLFFDYQILCWRVYRGRGETWGWLRDVNVGISAVVTFVDEGEVPDYTVGPPQGRNPFELFQVNGQPHDPRQFSYPSVVGFYQDRMVYGASAFKPTTLWFSRTGDYDNFDICVPGRDDDAIEIALASRKYEEIRSIIPAAKNMLVATSGGEWLVGGAGGEAITPTSFEAVQHSHFGASTLDPLLVDTMALLPLDRGGVRDISYDAQRQAFVGTDLLVYAGHLLDGYHIVAWAVSRRPSTVVWAVRSDGVLLTLTYCREQNVWGWARHTTGTATLPSAFKAVAVAPFGDTDLVYFAVERGDRWMVETTTVPGESVSLATTLDSYVQKDVGPVSPPEEKNRIFAPHLEGQWVNLVVDGTLRGAAVKVFDGVATVNPPATMSIVAGLQYAGKLELLDAPLDPTKDRTIKLVTWILYLGGFWLGQFAGSGENFTDLDYLPITQLDPDENANVGFRAHVEARVKNRWNRLGRATLVVPSGPPGGARVLGVVRELVTSRAP